ncbi:MAG: transcriptional regulator [Deltaproteobacteria bacterium]|nr:transcriptional regulator [Deltaproteobacteria bacterium]
MTKEPKVIKRYTNRKLYDTNASRYVTLDEIAQMVKSGDEVRIVDNRTKEDLTSVTLTQIIFEEEKKQKRILPLATLRNIIQSGGESLQEFIQKKIAQPVTTLRDEATQNIERIFKRGGNAGAEAGAEAGVEAEAGAGKTDGRGGPVREWVEGAQAKLDELQKKIDDRLRSAVDAVTHVPSLQREITELKERIASLEKALDEARRGPGGGAGPHS